jgi:hypothetical protein
VYGDIDKIRHKTEVLRQLCAEIGRNFADIELTTHFFPHLLGRDSDPSVYLDVGITHIIYPTQGPKWDIGPVRELLQWRQSLKRA